MFADHDYSFWLDSAMLIDAVSRFSFMGGIDPSHTRKLLADGDLNRLVSYSVAKQQVYCEYPHEPAKNYSLQQPLFDFLQQELASTTCQILGDALPFAFDCGLVGYFGYELKADLTGNKVHQSDLPDARFIQTNQVIAFDLKERTIYSLCLLADADSASADRWFQQVEKQFTCLMTATAHGENTDKQARQKTQAKSENITAYLTQPEADYRKDIASCQQKIHAGESYEICLTNSLVLNKPIDPLAYYLKLRQENPAPYAAFLRFPESSIACFSPERFLKNYANDKGISLAESKPVKGTIRRGKDHEEDQQLMDQLRNSVKDRAENLMITDLVRNDLGTLCEIGSVEVNKLMDIETFAKVHQMVSTISGRLKPEKTAIDCIKALFPAGSMTGAPKIRTMEIIDQLEQSARGIYSGALGYLSFNGHLDLNVVIRTAIFQSDKVTINTGSAVIALSDAEQEFQEILLKIMVLYQGLDGIY